MREIVWIDQYQLVSLSPADFPMLRASILQMHRSMEDSSHFIIDDLDTDLPELLSPTVGRVLGVLAAGELIAVQSLRYEAALNLRAYLPRGNAFEKRKIAECSWTMVDIRYRRQGLASRLLALVEKACAESAGIDCYLATVHPGNLPSLALYFGSGYEGLSFLSVFGHPRIVMVKDGRTHGASLVDVSISREIPMHDLSTQARLLAAGWVCRAVAGRQDGDAVLTFSPLRSRPFK